MPYIAAIDQGTTSTRCILFDAARPVVSAQREHRQIFPQPGWVEHDPMEIWRNTQTVIAEALRQVDAKPSSMAAVGLTNQRETTVAWDLRTGRPFYNAIVWQDTRTQGICDQLAADQGVDRFREQTGLPLATYFSAPKMRWLIDNVPELPAALSAGHAALGTLDAWLIWNLTGGPRSGRLLTDPTNASRTLLMNLHALQWDDSLLRTFDIPFAALPQIVPSSHHNAFGRTDPAGPFAAAIPITGCLGDQQAALVGQACFNPGDVKNTYGTGCFLLMNTGPEIPTSQSGLLSTVAYQFEHQPPVYALEGSVAIAGALVQWFRDNLGLINSSAEIEALATQVPDNGGVYIVPAFTGLFAPWWRPDARGTIVGLTQFSNRSHIARAALESAAYQTCDVLQAMEADTGIHPASLKVDGGMAANHLLMQFQADLLNLPIHRSAVPQATAQGAAVAAALGIGAWGDLPQIASQWRPDQIWVPRMDPDMRRRLCHTWQRAIKRSIGWME